MSALAEAWPACPPELLREEHAAEERRRWQLANYAESSEGLDLLVGEGASVEDSAAVLEAWNRSGGDEEDFAARLRAAFGETPEGL